MKVKDIPRYLKGVIPRKTKHFLLYDKWEKEASHSISVWGDFVCIRPLPANNMILVGAPDSSISPDKDYETSIYVCDHAQILIRGHKKGDLEIRVMSDEYPTRLIIDESEGPFLKEVL